LFQIQGSKSLPEVKEQVQDRAKLEPGCQPLGPRVEFWVLHDVATIHIIFTELLNLSANVRNSLCFFQNKHINGFKREGVVSTRHLLLLCKLNPYLCLLMSISPRVEKQVYVERIKVTVN